MVIIYGINRVIKINDRISSTAEVSTSTTLGIGEILFNGEIICCKFRFGKFLLLRLLLNLLYLSLNDIPRLQFTVLCCKTNNLITSLTVFSIVPCLV
jgi:hypothetical protein